MNALLASFPKSRLSPHFLSCHRSFLQDKTSKRSAQTKEKTINKLFDNDQEIINDNVKGNEQVAERNGEGSSDTEGSSYVLSANVSNTNDGW